MSDLISRQWAINALGEGAMVNYQAAGHDNGLIKAIDVIKGLPSAQPEKRTEKRTETHACDLISRKAAIDAINTHFGFNIEEEYGSAVQEVINGLPSAQPTYTEAEIQKMQDFEQAQIEKAYRLGYEEGKREAQPERKPYHEVWISALRTLPERKTGKWIKLDAHAHLADHKCSACGQECYVPTCMGDPMYDFCPNCGADMRGEQDD